MPRPTALLVVLIIFAVQGFKIWPFSQGTHLGTTVDKLNT